MQKCLPPVQQNLDVMEKNGCQIRIQRPKNMENDHTHQLCTSKKKFCNAFLKCPLIKLFVCVMRHVKFFDHRPHMNISNI